MRMKTKAAHLNHLRNVSKHYFKEKNENIKLDPRKYEGIKHNPFYWLETAIEKGKSIIAKLSAPKQIGYDGGKLEKRSEGSIVQNIKEGLVRVGEAINAVVVTVSRGYLDLSKGFSKVKDLVVLVRDKDVYLAVINKVQQRGLILTEKVGLFVEKYKNKNISVKYNRSKAKRQRIFDKLFGKEGKGWNKSIFGFERLIKEKLRGGPSFDKMDQFVKNSPRVQGVKLFWRQALIVGKQMVGQSSRLWSDSLNKAKTGDKGDLMKELNKAKESEFPVKSLFLGCIGVFCAYKILSYLRNRSISKQLDKESDEMHRLLTNLRAETKELKNQSDKLAKIVHDDIRKI